jgi:hypothetical protein
MNLHVRHGCAPEAVYQRLHAHEVRRRVEFLGQHRMLTCAQASLRLQAAGRSEDQALSAVRAQRELFYIQFIDVACFPSFQWRYLWLRPPIAQLLAVFGETKTKWQIALWLADANQWLEGLRPIDLLDANPGQVLGAAEWETRDPRTSH